MSKYKFIKIKDETNQYDTTNVQVETDAVTLEQIIADFQDFLKACGFSLEGRHLDLIDTDEDV